MPYLFAYDDCLCLDALCYKQHGPMQKRKGTPALREKKVHMQPSVHGKWHRYIRGRSEPPLMCKGEGAEDPFWGLPLLLGTSRFGTLGGAPSAVPQ